MGKVPHSQFHNVKLTAKWYLDNAVDQGLTGVVYYKESH